jgi:hypothetical protein
LQIKQEGGTHISNVQFYFYIRFGNDQYPLVLLFSLPDPQVFVDLSKTVYLSQPLSPKDGLVIIPVSAIHLVVSMFPEMCATEDGRILEIGKFSLMHHAFLKLAEFSNGELFDEDDLVESLT